MKPIDLRQLQELVDTSPDEGAPKIVSVRWLRAAATEIGALRAALAGTVHLDHPNPAATNVPA